MKEISPLVCDILVSVYLLRHILINILDLNLLIIERTELGKVNVEILVASQEELAKLLLVDLNIAALLFLGALDEDLGLV